MNTRRGFLKSGALGASACLRRIARAQDRTTGATDSQPGPARDYWNDFPNYLIGLVNSARARRKSELAKVTSADAARERSAFVAAKVWELIGGRPEPTPLNPVVTGRIERPAYRIEKLIFESQPRFYVTAHLYLPKSVAAPFPVILGPVGHVEEGKSYLPYQLVYQNLARKGFAVLAYDPPGQGERQQYFDATGRSLYGPTGEHNQFGWPALLVGSSTTWFEVWDGIRAVDYLVSRPEIDRARIGCCGHSGGGTQTMFLCALEPRIKAAVVVEGNTENFAGAEYEPPGAFADAEQNIIGGLKAGIDRGDLLCAFAPKPLRICYTTHDAGSTYSPHYIQGTQEVFEEARQFYRLQGAADRVSLFHSMLPHSFDDFQRGATYEWFGKWLHDRALPGGEAPLDEAPESSLWCTSTGQVLSSIGGRAAFEVTLDRLRSVRPHPDRSQVTAGLLEVLAVPSARRIEGATTISRRTMQDVTIEEIEFVSKAPIRVPGWFVKAADGNRRAPALVLIQDLGRDGLFSHLDTVQRIVRQGISVCSVDLRTTGTTRPRLPSSGPVFYGDWIERGYGLASLWAGTPIVGQQTTDLLGCLEYLASRPDVAADRVAIASIGHSSLPALFAAALDERVRGLFLDRGLLDLESIVAAKKYDLPLAYFAPGLLRKADLPDICAAIAPRVVLWANPVDPAGDPVAADRAAERYRTVQSTTKVTFDVRPDAIGHLLPDWAHEVLGG
jgi:cephalosporin-C deacetylase-like acetyl esterase